MHGHHDNPLEDEELLDQELVEQMKTFSLDGCWFLMALIAVAMFIHHLWRP